MAYPVRLIPLAAEAPYLSHEALGSLCVRLRGQVNVKDHRVRFKMYKGCFTGREVVGWLLEHGEASTVETAVAIGQEMVNVGMLVKVNTASNFQSSSQLLRFSPNAPTTESTRLQAHQPPARRKSDTALGLRLSAGMEIPNSDQGDSISPYGGLGSTLSMPSLNGFALASTTASPATQLQFTFEEFISEPLPVHIDDVDGGTRRTSGASSIISYGRGRKSSATSASNMEELPRLSSSLEAPSMTHLSAAFGAFKRKDGKARGASHVRRRSGPDLNPLPAWPISDIAQKMEAVLDIHDRRSTHTVHRNVFVGSDAAAWLVQQGYADSKGQACLLGEQMRRTGIIESVGGDFPFEDSGRLYHFVWTNENGLFDIDNSGSPAASSVGPPADQSDEMEGEGAAIPSDLTLASCMAAELCIADRTVGGKTYRNCFYAKDAVSWLIALGYADDEGDAVAIGESMVSRGLIEGAAGDGPFRNDTSLFTFTRAVPLPKTPTKQGQDTTESRRDAQIRQLEELLDQWDAESGNPEDTDKIIERVLATRRSRRQAEDVGLNQLSASDIHGQSGDPRKRMLQFLPFEDILRTTVFTRRSSMSVVAITPEGAMAITKDGAIGQQHRANRPTISFRFVFDQFSGCLLFLNPEQGNVEAAMHLCEVWEVRRNVHPKGTDPTLAARTLGLWQAGMMVCVPLTFEDATTHDLWAHCLTLLLNIAHSPAPTVTQWLRREWILVREATDGALPGRVGLEMIERALGHPRGGLDQNVLAKHMVADDLTPTAFLNLFVELTILPRLAPIFAALVGGGVGGMTRATFVEFLVHVQKEPEDRVQSILSAYFPKEDRLMKELDFAIFLLAPHNSCFDPSHMQICDDMTQPLSHYYIASSHNTYLLEDQLKSPSSVEGYIRALLLRCRCVELDVWDGSDGYPRVTHGHTLCSSIGAKEALEVIREYAFVHSSYPLILSFENHCSPTQETRLASLCDEIFGNIMVTSRNSQPKRFDRLPSPEELRGRILIKARISTWAKDLAPPQPDGPTTPLSPPSTPHKTSSQSLSTRFFGSNSNLCLSTLGTNGNSRLSSSSDTSLSRIEVEGRARSNSTQSRSNSGNNSDLLKPRASHRRKGSEGLQLEDFLKDDPIKLMKKSASIREAQWTNSKELQKQSSRELQKQSSRELKRRASLESQKTMSRDLMTLEQALQNYNERSATQHTDVVTLEQMLESPLIRRDRKFDVEKDSSIRRLDLDGDAQSRSSSQRSNRKTQAQRTPSFTSGTNLTLTDLTLYCISASYKGLCPGLDVQAYNEMGSFGEDKAKKLASTHGKKWIRHNTIYLSRIYPSGKRVNSSNYCPQSLWNAGCQMVALNYQTSDRPMALNQARFGQYNGGCGYVLKPPAMRDPAALMYSIRASKEKTVEKEEPIILTVQVLSSQLVSLAKDESPTTKINLVIKIDGCTNDLCWRQSHRLRNAPFVPDWQFKTIFHLEEPSHAVLSFYVVKSQKSYGKKVEKDVACYGLPVKSLLLGYRMVPLMNMQHDRLASDYLLVYVTKTPQTNIYAPRPQPA